MRPYKLEKVKLDKSIHLSESIYSKPNSFMISAPLIIDNIAILKQSDASNEVIIVAINDSGKWEVICEKWVVQTTYD